ncbi:MAG: hypothetical protein ABI721_02095 [Candidatus Dojkabacteria bacterium]
MHYQPILLDTKGIDILDKDTVLDEVSRIYKQLKESLSVFEIKAEGQSIGVESLKKFSSWLWNRNDELKVLIVFQAEKLTLEAQNSLLKIVEEPPEKTVIILSSRNSDTLLQTINSRCITMGKVSKSNDAVQMPAFLQGNYINRIKLIDSLTKEDNSRENALKLVEELINYYLEDKEYRMKSDKLLEIYLGIKSGTNLKLSLSLVNQLVST